MLVKVFYKWEDPKTSFFFFCFRFTNGRKHRTDSFICSVVANFQFGCTSNKYTLTKQAKNKYLIYPCLNLWGIGTGVK